MNDWKPGDVALVQNEYGVWNRAILQVQPLENRWVYGVAYSDMPTNRPARRLVVIDYEDREQVERLTRGWYDAANIGGRATAPNDTDYLQAALREFANPTPPATPEPTAPFATVRDADGHLWARVDDEAGGLNWMRHQDHEWAWWADLPQPVTVVSQGVES